MEVEKSHDLMFASWRHKKASGVILAQTLRPENQGSQYCKSQSEFEGLRTRSTMPEGRRWLSQLKQQKQICPPSPIRSTQALNKLDGAHPH